MLPLSACVFRHVLSLNQQENGDKGESLAHPNTSGTPSWPSEASPAASEKGAPQTNERATGHSHACTFLPNTKWLLITGVGVVWPELKNRDLRTICFHTILSEVLYFSP